MYDLAIIIVSHGDESWLPACLSTVAGAAEGISLDVVVVDNSGEGGVRELIERDFAWARAVTCENRGFAHACNLGLKGCRARYVLFLNPDTEIASGTFGELI